jgi:hypothetical protein
MTSGSGATARATDTGVGVEDLERIGLVVVTGETAGEGVGAPLTSSVAPTATRGCPTTRRTGSDAG